MGKALEAFGEAFVVAVAIWTCAAVLEHHAKHPVAVAQRDGGR